MVNCIVHHTVRCASFQQSYRQSRCLAVILYIVVRLEPINVEAASAYSLEALRARDIELNDALPISLNRYGLIAPFCRVFTLCGG
jgi:hypothetical protein